MPIDSIKSLTAHADINEMLVLLANQLKKSLSEKLIGLYLTGSLTYDSFNRDSSDIDFLVLLNQPLSKVQLKNLTRIHSYIEQSYLTWAKRIEGSYITKAMLLSTQPPKISRPYFNRQKMFVCPYGNEWLLNLYVLYECGIALIGPNIRELIDPINSNLVREASKKDLHEEWKPKLKNPSSLQESQQQAYAVLTLCRILYRDKNDGVVSKPLASAWVKNTYNQWADLIKKAEDWQYGKTMDQLYPTLDFLRFTLNEVS